MHFKWISQYTGNTKVAKIISKLIWSVKVICCFDFFEESPFFLAYILSIEIIQAIDRAQLTISLAVVKILVFVGYYPNMTSSEGRIVTFSSPFHILICFTWMIRFIQDLARSESNVCDHQFVNCYAWLTKNFPIIDWTSFLSETSPMNFLLGRSLISLVTLFSVICPRFLQVKTFQIKQFHFGISPSYHSARVSSLIAWQLHYVKALLKRWMGWKNSQLIMQFWIFSYALEFWSTN